MTILTPSQIKQGLSLAGVTQNLDILTAIILAESGGDTNAQAPAGPSYTTNGTLIQQPGAYGLGQFTPATASSLGYTTQQLLDPTTAFQAIAQLSNNGANLTPWDAYSFISQNGVETNVGAGKGSFQQFLGLTDSTAPVTNGSSTVGLNIPGVSIPGISGITSSIASLPQNIVSSLTSGISGSIKSLESYIQRVGFFIIGAGILVAGLFILGSGNSSIANVVLPKGGAASDATEAELAE